MSSNYRYRPPAQGLMCHEKDVILQRQLKQLLLRQIPIAKMSEAFQKPRAQKAAYGWISTWFTAGIILATWRTLLVLSMLKLERPRFLSAITCDMRSRNSATTCR